MNDRTLYLRNYYYMNKHTVKIKQKEWVKKNKEYVNSYMREYMRLYRLNKALKKKSRVGRGIVKLQPKKPYFLKIEKKDIMLYFD